MKKIFCALMAILILVLTFTACGNGAASDELTTIDIAALPPIIAGVSKGKSPQDEVMFGLEKHFPEPENGYRLDYKEYNSGKEALEALEKGEVDFTLIATKKEYVEYNSEFLANLGPVYFYPMAIYLRTWEKVSDVTSGASIAIPDDAENMARALLLLAENDYITLKEGAGLKATLDDIETNERSFVITPMAHDKVASSEADILVMGSLEASAAGFERRFDAYVSEKADSEVACEYAVSFIVRTEDIKSTKIELVRKYFFTRRMYNAIDGSTDTIIDPMFDIK